MGRIRKRGSYLVSVVLFLLWFVRLAEVSIERDTLNPDEELTEHGFLESPNKLFRLKQQPRDHFLTSWRRENLYWCSGKWNGQNFSYFPAISEDSAFKFSYISNENESYFVFTVPAYFISSWIEMNSSGHIHMFLGADGGWTLWYLRTCDVNENHTRSEACIDQKPSKCSSNDEFLLTTGNMDSDGTGCKCSSGQRYDELDHGFAQTFYIRIGSSSEKNNSGISTARNTTETQTARKPKKNRMWVTIVAPLVSITVLAIICSLCYLMLKETRKPEEGYKHWYRGIDTRIGD
ncbi:hypothetical protein FEM48_Zijuj01G0202500 [Ziziphus jujuba var. spinosa]|uniref:S-locus glycoprotein domain-containing protein n=1 Tax=Ziziphus jujuba var. spinosa TaxID=714518 RepID=A0A978W3C0_ZIZJJ|nr:hypothetical protein FEM48_Zijuj01G0202500 [Ziziphus jujuba var. spinosa]